jgi:transcriptional regulator of acetoin/glycerol metabolism
VRQPSLRLDKLLIWMKIEYADRGTAFMDEIGDIPLSIQAQLLR